MYHTLLSGLRTLDGVEWWADQGLHTAVPLLTLLWWAGFAPKQVGWADLPWWLLWPMVYCVYAMIRGSVTGTWAYPFLNLDTLGSGRVALNIMGLVLGFSALCAGLILLARRLDR